ncbi:GNAT family N-acetyltransferase [Streptomyces sp. NPDC051555]|uniref:GNAT family N-acetyltransferase n=1 Tax=Streptomyces sp. NPDC051555 TaxID=3365657 RepID=UPI0037B30560
MSDVEAALVQAWPAVLSTARLVLRPAGEADMPMVRELLMDAEVRRFLGGAVTRDRLVARARSYLGRPGAWVVALDGRGVGLVVLGADHRVEGRAELSYQLLPSVWGARVGREAVAAVLGWWQARVPRPASVVAVTQQANVASCRVLEAVGMVRVDTVVEYGALQCVYALVGSERVRDSSVANRLM